MFAYMLKCFICIYMCVCVCGWKWCVNQIHLEVSSHIFAFAFALNTLQHSVQRETLVCVCVYVGNDNVIWDGTREKDPLLLRLHSSNRPQSFPIKEQPGLEEHSSFLLPTPPPLQLKTVWLLPLGRHKVIWGKEEVTEGERMEWEKQKSCPNGLWPFTFCVLFRTEGVEGRQTSFFQWCFWFWYF